MSNPTTTSIYGKIIPSRSRDDTTLKTEKLVGFKYPLEASPKNGYFSKSSGFNVIKSSLKSLIKTERGERFMLPDYGCNLRKFLMEPLDEITFGMVRDEITVSIKKYLRQVSLNKLQVFETDLNTLYVKLFCSVRDNATISFDIGVDI